MEYAKGMATGFVVGVAAIGVLVALLYTEDDSAHVQNTERIEKLEAHVEQLELAVNRLAGQVADSVRATGPMTATPTALNSVATSARNPSQLPR